MHAQNVRDFPQAKHDGEINSSFLLNEHDYPRIFFQVFAKNNLIKNTFEEEKKFDTGTRLFSENSSQLGVFWPRRGLQANRRVTVDLFRRSWVRFPPRSKDFFFTSCGSLIPFTRANAQWVIHGFK